VSTPLTGADLRVLRFALGAPSRGEDGITPRGSTPHRHFAKLVRRGLLRDNGWGVHVDDHFKDVRLYVITQRGVRMLARANGGAK
jgi:hypothetical protein